MKRLRKKFSISGIGLHTGKKSVITFLPSDAQGYIFIRNGQSINVNSNSVVDVVRGTTIKNGVTIYTVEHVLSALYGLGIDGAIMELTSEEPPVCDGSSLEFANKILEVGIDDFGKEEFYTVKEKLEYKYSNTIITIEPYDRLIITCEIDFENKIIGRQSITIDLDPNTYIKAVAPARTFCFDYEVEAIKKMGLGKGGSLKNTIVVGLNKVHIEGGLRFTDEFVRHKLLDFIGDLALLGRKIKGKVYAYRPGHGHNVNFVKILEKNLVKID